MNAINFIKQHGVDKAREVVSGAPDRATTVKPSLDFKHFMYGICENAAGAYILLSDLKHLVESVELVEHFGNDLVGAKQLLEFSKDCKTIELSGSVITVERLKQAIADYESVYSNDMGDDTHIENHVSPLCKTESQPVLIVERDNQIIERLKAENKMLHEAASTHLKNQMHFKKLYDALVEQLYPYAIDLEEPVDGDVNITPQEFIDGYNRARECAHYNLLEMMESDEEYIRAQCGMLGGGGGSDESN